MLPPMRWSVLIPALTLAACGAESEHQPEVPTRPNFVIIDIDSMRADMLSATHGGEPLAPAIHALAQQGVRFDNAFAQSSWTYPALASVLTGRYPPSFASMNPREQQIADLGSTLPDILGLYGYHSAVAWGETAPLACPAFTQGFDRRLHPQRPGADARLIAEFLEETPEPFLLMVHDMDLHRPVPRPPLDLIEGHTEQRPAPSCESLNNTWKGDREAWGEEATRARVQACYRAAMQAYDPAVGALMDQLQRSSLDERTVVILVSNHGEEMFEHGQLGHAELQYDTVLLVPLVILDPAVEAPATRTEVVQQVDLVPTILARADIPQPHDLDGHSLLPLLGLADGDYPERDVFGFANPRYATLRTRTHKLIHSAGGGGTTRLLFDLDSDPDEHMDLVATHPDIAAELGARLDAFIAEREAQGRAAPKQPGSERLTEELRERGYWEMVREPPEHERAP